MENTIVEYNPFYGIIADVYPETDYQLLAGAFDLPKARHTFYENNIQYDQNDVGLNTCTLHGTIGAVSDLSGVKFTLEQRKSLHEQALKLGFKDDRGWFVSEAVDLARKLCSEWLNEELVSYRVTLAKDEFWSAINNGYSIVVGFSGNAAYSKDHREDGVLDLTKNLTPVTYGHCLRMCKSKQAGMIQLIVDNYPAGGRNTYTIPEGHLELLVKNKVFFLSGYVFGFKNEVTPLNTNVSPWAIGSWKKAVAKKYIVGNEDPKFVVGDALAEVIHIKKGLLTSQLGNVTLEREVVAADRAGALD